MIWAFAAYTASLVHSVPGDLSLPGLIGFWAASILLMALTAVALMIRRRRLPWTPYFYALIMALSLGLNFVTNKGPSIIPAYIVVGVTTSSISLRWGGVFTIVAVAGAKASDVLHGGHMDIWAVLGFVGVFFAGLSGREAELARAAERRTAVLAERATIAREIHDILAHSLSAQVVHLEGARMLLARDGDKDQVLERVERAQRLARSGLEETRRALATLRGDAPAPDEALAVLAEEFRAATGRPCDLEIIGPSRDLSPAAGLAVVRTAQEALTNIRKHAPGARAVVRLRYAPDGTTLEVSDTGGRAASAPAPAGAGYGLVGMRERAELIEGTLEAGPGKEGFRVFLKVPHE